MAIRIAPYRKSCTKRCQGERGGGGSDAGSLSTTGSGPGSSGACTSGITGSTGFALAACAGFADFPASSVSGAGSDACVNNGVGVLAGGDVTSITGRVTLISASGTFQAKPRGCPSGATGFHVSETTPSAVHARSP